MKARDWLAPALGFALALAGWGVGVRLFEIPEYLLPSPAATVARIDFNLVGHALTTLEEAALGFLLANSLALLAAVAFVHCPPLERSLFPLAVAMKTTPLAALAPLLVVWMGTGLASKVAAAALISFFPTLVNAVKGLKTVEHEMKELFACYGIGAWDTFWQLRFPNALPYIMAGLKISTSLSVVGAIVGEFVGASRGLGYIVLVSSYHMDTPTMFAAVIFAAAVGMSMFWLVGAVERRVVFWQKVDT